MATEPKQGPRRPRISVDVHPDMRHRLKLAAAKADLSVQQYVLETLRARLQEDLREDHLSGRTDPVLGELWDNPRDAAYDQL